jgi:hypothetical protein
MISVLLTGMYRVRAVYRLFHAALNAAIAVPATREFETLKPAGVLWRASIGIKDAPT